MGRRARIVTIVLLLGLVSIGASALPDLLVSAIDIEPAHPQIGQSVFIEVTISNHGPDDVDNAFFVHFFVDDHEIAIQPIVGGIASGGSKRVAFEWLALAACTPYP